MKVYEITFIVGYTLHKMYIDAKSEEEATAAFWCRIEGLKATLVKVKLDELDIRQEKTI